MSFISQQHHRQNPNRCPDGAQAPMQLCNLVIGVGAVVAAGRWAVKRSETGRWTGTLTP